MRVHAQTLEPSLCVRACSVPSVVSASLRPHGLYWLDSTGSLKSFMRVKMGTSVAEPRWGPVAFRRGEGAQM